MGLEFLDIFEKWANEYDASVSGKDEQYREVFRNYNEILEYVADRSIGHVIEFGTGTGNLTKKLLEKELTVVGIEPSVPMRQLAHQKLGADVLVTPGDFLQFDTSLFPAESLVSTYAFHHLTDKEKEEAVINYGKLLQTGGKIVFADTMFETADSFADTIVQAKQKGYTQLAEDLEREYYTTIPVLKQIFESNGFHITFTQFNRFVWVLEATKQ